MLLLIGLQLLLAVQGFLHIDPETRFFVDDNGRSCIFHGVNAVYKIPPYHPDLTGFTGQTSLSSIDMDNLEEWGFTFVRLGTMWPGVAPAKGQYNYTYLSIIEGLVNDLGKRGIYTLLDMHQDLLSRKFCGEGAPDWAIKVTDTLLPFPFPALFSSLPTDPKTGYPELAGYVILHPVFGVAPAADFVRPTALVDPALRSIFVHLFANLLVRCLNYTFARFYFAMATGSAFDSLYNDKEISAAFGDFWYQVSKYFAKNKYVAGYELINEPWPGDIYKDPKLVIEAGYADLNNLQPLYELAAYVPPPLSTSCATKDEVTELRSTWIVHIGRIRSVDDDHIIFFEPTLIDYAHLTPGFTSVPGGPNYNNRSVFSYHIYCGSTDRQGEPTNRELCEVEESLLFDLFHDDVDSLGGGGMLTEWGNMPNGPKDIDQINDMTGAADNLLQSWAWWQFKSFNDITTSGVGTSESFYDEKGNLQTEKVMALSRTYAYATAGTPNTMVFNPTTKQFDFQYWVSLAATANTEIYLNQKWHYPNGFKVSITPPSAATWSQIKPNRIQLIHSKAVRDGDTISIVIQPK